MMICIFHSVVLLRRGLVLQILKTEDPCFMASSPKLFAHRFKNRLLYPELHHRDEICGPNRPCRLPLLMLDKPTLWCFHTGLFYNISCCCCCSRWCRDSNFQISWKKLVPRLYWGSRNAHVFVWSLLQRKWNAEYWKANILPEPV